MKKLDERAASHIRDFGLRANFRAALHCGPVVIGELGAVKMEIAFLGDTMNTAARLQEACRDTGQRVLASAALVNCLAALPPGIAKRSIGRLRVRRPRCVIVAVGGARWYAPQGLLILALQRRPRPARPNGTSPRREDYQHNAGRRHSGSAYGCGDT